VVIKVIPLFNLSEEAIFELRPDNGRDLEEKVEFLDEVFTKGEIGAGHIVCDDVA
jgi:hypothetical protein